MKFLSQTLRTLLLAAAIGATLIPFGVTAGVIEGFVAAQKGDFATAARLYGLAAAQGDASAQLKLAYLYLRGQGVAQDDREAARLYGLAAAQGDADAQIISGLMYENGRGVAQDYKEAARLYGLAAAQGIANAQFNLGNAYNNGQGVAQDYKEAARLYGLAAEQGHADAQSNLGLMYSKGKGVTQSNIVAYALFNLSATKDPSVSNAATKNRRIIAEEMSNAQIEEAQALTKEINKLGNLLKAIETYLAKNSTPKQTKASSGERVAAADRDDGFPARPAKRPGVVSCNTSCVNASCMRTYDNGKKVRFQAQQVFDPFSQQWKFESGNC